MSSFPLHFILLFILFPSVLSFLSPLVFSFLSPSFSLFKLPFWVFWLSPCFFVQQKKYLFRLLPRSPFLSSLFHQKKTSFSLFPFLLCFFKNYVIFPCLVFFSVLKNDLSFCITLVSFASYFELCFFFLLSFFFDVSRNKNLVFAGKCGKNFLLFSVSVLLV